MELQPGQTAVVTGGASGIGLALARAFLKRGLNVVVADFNDTALKTAGESLADGGDAVSAVHCDVSSFSDVESLRDHTLERFGRVDVVCNNAGVITPMRKMWEHNLDDFKFLFGINVMGVVYGVRAFVPLLVEQGSGHVLNTSSMAGVATIPFNAPYNVTKHAVVTLTETLAAEFAQLGLPLGATVLCPGLVETDIRSTLELRPGASEGSELRPETTPADMDGTRVSADEAAEKSLAAIEADRLHVFSNPGSGTRVKERVERLLADLPD